MLLALGAPACANTRGAANDLSVRSPGYVGIEIPRSGLAASQAWELTTVDAGVTRAFSAHRWYADESREYGVPMARNAGYEVVFDARADRPIRVMALIQQQSQGRPIMAHQILWLTTDWALYKVTIPPQASLAGVYQALRFVAADGPAQVWFYDVSMAATGPMPAIPRKLTATPGSGRVSLAWFGPSIGGNVAGYDVFRDGEWIARVLRPRYTDTGVKNSTPHSYTVDALDPAGRRSPRSSLVWSTPEPPCTAYASPAGGGDGSSSSTPDTLESVVSSVGPGSVVCLEPGTYDETTNVWFSESGTRLTPIVYRNYGGTALIRYTGGNSGAQYLSGGLVETSDGENWAGTHDVVIDGLEIDGANVIGSGVAVTQGSHNITIENCVIRNTGASGISLNATDYVTVEHNLVYHTGYGDGWSSAISLWNGGADPSYGGESAWYDTYEGFHNIIAGNIVSGSYDNSGAHTDGNGIIVDGAGSIPPALIANNLVYENGGRGILNSANSGDVWIVNNTAYANGLDLNVDDGQAGDYMANEATNTHFVNDLAYGRIDGATYTTGYTYYDNASSVGWVRNLGYNGAPLGVAPAVLSDPSEYLYVDPQLAGAPRIPVTTAPWDSAMPPWDAGDDFAVRPTSPTINAGASPTSGMTAAEAASAQTFLMTDLSGARRTEGSVTDIGAYEYASNDGLPGSPVRLRLLPWHVALVGAG